MKIAKYNQQLGSSGILRDMKLRMKEAWIINAGMVIDDDVDDHFVMKY